MKNHIKQFLIKQLEIKIVKLNILYDESFRSNDLGETEMYRLLLIDYKNAFKELKTGINKKGNNNEN